MNPEAGEIVASALVLVSPSGTRWRIMVGIGKDGQESLVTQVHRNGVWVAQAVDIERPGSVDTSKDYQYP